MRCLRGAGVIIVILGVLVMLVLSLARLFIVGFFCCERVCGKFFTPFLDEALLLI